MTKKPLYGAAAAAAASEKDKASTTASPTIRRYSASAVATPSPSLFPVSTIAHASAPPVSNPAPTSAPSSASASPSSGAFQIFSAKTSRLAAHPVFSHCQLATIDVPINHGATEQLLLSMQPGFSEPPHSHSSAKQWTVLQGKFSLIDALSNESVIVGSGDVIVFPAKKVFSVTCVEAGVVLQAFFGKVDFLFHTK
jgi:quercetin dioxygenase-like cupin family protein